MSEVHRLRGLLHGHAANPARRDRHEVAGRTRGIAQGVPAPEDERVSTQQLIVRSVRLKADATCYLHQAIFLTRARHDAMAPPSAPPRSFSPCATVYANGCGPCDGPNRRPASAIVT